MPDTPTRQAITVYLDRELYDRLRQVAFDRHTKMNVIVREALEQALAPSPPPIRTRRSPS